MKKCKTCGHEKNAEQERQLKSEHMDFKVWTDTFGKPAKKDLKSK